MKLLLLSDIHTTDKTPIGRTDNIFKTFERKFTFILQYAQKHNATILQAGDFFNEARNWQVLFLMVSLLKKYKVPIYSIFGQHDLYMRSNPETTPTTMGVLKNLNLIKILNENPTVFDDIYIHGCSWGNDIPQPKLGKINILVIHAPITIKELFPNHNFTAISHFISKNKYWNLILAGDIHVKSICKKEKTTFINTGPMLRLTSTQYNFKHQPCFFLYNTKSCNLKEIIIPHEKAKLVLSRKHIINKPTDPTMLPPTTLKQFAKLLKKKKNYQKPLKIILDNLIKKHNASEEVRQYLIEVMNNES